MTNQQPLDDNMQKRIKKLFSGQETPSFASIREVDAMKARISELETKLAFQPTTHEETSLPAGEIRTSPPSPPEPIKGKRIDPGQAKQTQMNAFRSALVVMCGFIASLPVFIYLSNQTNAWQVNGLIWITLGLAIVSAASASLARRGRINLSMGLLVGAICLLVPGVSMLVSGLGLILGVSITLAILLIVGQTLTGSSATRAGAVGVLAGVASLVVDLFWPWNRLSLPQLQTIIPILAIVAISALGFALLRQFAAYPLRIKLVILFAGVALGSISAVAFVTNRVVSSEISQEVGTNLASIAQGKALEVGTIIDRDKDTLETLTLNKALQDGAEAASMANSGNQTELDRLDKQWRDAESKHDPLLQQVLNNEVAGDLREFQAQFPQFAEVFLTDKYGANIAATNRTSDYYQADEEWWQAAWNNGKGGLFISEPVFDESTGVIAINIAMPMRSQYSSRIAGILRATVDVTLLRETLAASDFGQTGGVDLIFPDNQFIHGETKTALAQLAPETITQLAALNGSYLEFDYDGRSSLVSRSLVSASGSHAKDELEALGWYVVVHQDRSAALQPVAATTRTTVLVSLAVLILAGFLASYAGRLLTTPLSHLTAVATQVSEGDLTARASVNSRDEIGILASTFNSMTAQLRDLLGSLEQRVADRTHDLELATEVGRAVSEKVGNLTEMLSHSVESIRSKYELYYTQIYLMDASARSLVLRAGTGDAGMQLLRRGHRLAISASSLNSRAASTQKSVLVDDTQKSADFLPNPLLPLTRSELAVPLIANDRVVGVLDMQSEKPDTFSEAKLPAFQVLAGQLAIAIQNAALFNQTEEARSQVEEQARRLASSGWQEFLNAVDRSESIGFVFSQGEVLPLVETQPSAFENTLIVPIQITGANVGEVQLADDADRKWTSAETQIVEAAISQVAQHVENLRLLAQARLYRHEAEQVSRRLTAEGWNEYFRTRKELADGYGYELDKVQPLNGSGSHDSATARSYPLMVHDEPIGVVLVDADDDAQSHASEVVVAIVERLGDHIENLRLLEQAEQRRLELQEGEARLRTLVENAPEAIVVVDLSTGLFTEPNENATRLYGLSREELLKVGPAQMSPPTQPDGRDSTEKAMEKIGEAMQGGAPVFEWTHRNAQGQDIPCEVRLVRLPSDRPLVRASVTDITERKMAETALAEGEARLRTLIENAPEAIVVVDLSTGLFTEPNENATKLYGLSREELLKVGPAQMSPPTQPDGRDSTEKAMEKIGEAMQGLTPVFDWTHRNAQGEDIPCEVRLVRLPGDRPLVRASVTDISERKRAQETIARRATELQTVAQVSTTASTVLDPDALLQSVVDLTKESFGVYHAHIYLANESWNTLLLAAGAGEIGRQLVSEQHSIPMDAEKSLVARAARERTAVIVNDVRSDPGYLPNPLLSETRAEMAVPMIVGNKVLGIFDVQSSDPSGFSPEDAHIYTTLASQVAVALQNAQLYVEQSATVTQLRELDRLKSSFLANMSHELRTPLNSILGFTDVMLEELDGPLTENMDNDLRLIQKNGQHLLHLINDVLDMAKIESGRMNLNPEKLKVHEILEEAVSITSTLADEKNLSLVIEDGSDQNVEIYADRTRLRQVMINLVNNSIKFTEKGKVAICAQHQDEKVLIAVKDTGISIPTDQLEAVFQEFTQVDTSTTRKGGGTGLGLPISRRLVEMHGGHLWAESTGVVGEGSTFYVELPLEAQITEAVETLEK